MKKLLHKIAGWLVALRNRYLGDTSMIYVAAGVLGVLSGVAAAILKGCITWVMDLVFHRLNIHQGNWEVLILPIIGLFLAVIITRYLVKQPLDHATDMVADDLRLNKAYLSPKVIFGSIITCSFTLGLGGSAGAESPIAYTAAGIGSNIGRIFHLPEEKVLSLLGCGAAAGIAGIYMAPIGGMMYAFEVLKMRQTLETVLSMTVACLASALSCYLLLGCHTDVTFVPNILFDTHLILYVIGCGVFCGLYSVYYSVVLHKCRKYFAKVSNIWLRVLSGGVMLAMLLYLFPSLYGEGYDTLSKLMAHDSTTIIAYGPLYRLGKDTVVLMVLFGVLLLAKPVATSATNDSGGVGGDFTPTFFCGGVAGFLFAMALNHFFGLHLPVAMFAFFGMGAVMAGACQAPLMAIFIASEMTGYYGFILPLTLVALASYLTMQGVKQFLNNHYHLLPAQQSLTAKAQDSGGKQQ